MQVQHFTHWLKDYAKQALLNNERRLVVLSGSETWALSLIGSIDVVSEFLQGSAHEESNLSAPHSTCLIYGDSATFPANVQKKRYRDKLGSESDVIIFVDSQFTIDAFAALSGTLKAGGLFFIVLTELNKYSQESLFFKRFYALIQVMPCHTIITELQAKLSPPSICLVEPEHKDVHENYPLGCITAEQYSAVQAIVKVVTGHRKRPLVLTADRGRGKSSALAISCAQLLQANEESVFQIVITAPDIQALAVFFRQLSDSLPKAEQRGNTFTFGNASLVFVPVDQLLKQPVNVNLVLVDEAAAIPVYLLEQLLAYNHRMVFASTVHGYEGAGRGFTLKFQKTLARLCPQWKSLHIKQPIRWRQDDPLERLVFDGCLLNAELSVLTPPLKINTADSANKKCNYLEFSVFKVITAKELLNDEGLLQQVFAILVTAHYQTKPSDLQLLLDNPQVQLACLFSTNSAQLEVIAVALLMNEGKNNGVDEADVRAIKSSQRRLRSHFLPQSLLSHCGFEQAFDYNYLRIMRIAVHPQIQQQGIGLHFLAKIQQLAAGQGADFIGSSFGVNHQLLAFWLKVDFTIARIGFTKDKASGEHSALVILGVNALAEQRQQLFKRDFYRSFDYLLLEEYKSLNSKLVHLLLRQNEKEYLAELSTADIVSVHAYAKGERLYSSCAYSLYLWLKHDLVIQSKYESGEVIGQSLVLIARLVQKHDTDTVCQLYGLTGKKMLNQYIKDYICMRLKLS
ncbi:tRNA(Met) cytidine acetyltransferase TmcA [Colwellia psychrerythraea]|uniref:tRNA(Met) cytidine acetyltransferase TmcA n=1 Tax=Colwellia psychrerythraea TaxID=28229 RepID=A0A099KKW7_COLPS|nr:GNAT family N-acetyltransferase [Colwellia psychrerythraea]KGJ90567.1 tRNA(Met) cytidine acetyltransferase TmcA [Colwellia psychrerythraea]